MAQTLEALLHRTQTLGTIRGIVHTMKTLSVINAVPYEQAARSVEAYHATILDGLAAFLHATGGLDLAGEGAQTHVVVVFGSDHGLCGSYNEVLASHLAAHIAERPTAAAAPRILCVGAQMNDALAARGLVAEQVLLTPASPDGIGRLAGLVVAQLDAIRRAAPRGGLAVSLAYTRRAGGQQEPYIDPFLPLSPHLVQQLTHRKWESRALPGFTMDPDALFAALIRGHIFSGVFRASAEALVTENAARLATMHQAEQSIDDRLGELQNETRTVRQTEITTELLDVVIGFEALSAQRRKRTKAMADGTDADGTDGVTDAAPDGGPD